ncbi:hypothetical protein [Calothrix sp. 336/3]|uniref:hypothetical protein n=1 Tax=Calothrix sp. 336/3 TaxID=1337936 RepID=UPI0004E43A05|nr:hypothetical protein [Calothrix sp. 336/3]AKG22649.1 hypothetical protein IJ00_16435 [Calothrix sp. 336/3]
MSFQNFQSGLSQFRPLLTLLVIVWLVGTFGLGWLVNSLLIIFGLLFLVPVIAFVGFRWWLQRNIITDSCPVCGFTLTGLNQVQLQCPSCGEQLIVKEGHFQRFAPDGTIDVTAVEVTAKSIED